ncbi:MAG TPA: alanyl-tRNA editing protein [Gemmatimonadales bacterium]|nr:alanyl-tRNA editing protein [Gemmatimonadales bacterium]
MTSRRYYSDSYTRVFTARVTETLEDDGSPAVVLDRTWFYPTGGGQPHDTGHVGSVPVVEVGSRDTDGAVIHRLAGPAPAGEVEGVIDWPRRFDHMQQHTGQHVLSAAFVKVADAPTIGFHLGADYVSIDLGVRELTEAKAGDAEELANAAVRSNLPVRAWFPEPDELAALPLRKTPDVQGALRVVAIGDFDVTACGGTHVAASGEVGQIKLLRTERLTRGIRVAFLSGDRARADYGKKHALVQGLAGSLSCGPDEVPGAVSRLRASLDETRRELALWKAAALRTEAERLASAAEDRGSRVVLAAFENRPAEEIRELALRLTERPGTIALLGTSGARTQIVFARSEDLAADLRPGLDRALAELGGGRGGGGRVLQGGAGPADRARLQAALEAARSVVEVPA